MKHALSKRQCNLPQDRETLVPTVNRALLTERLRKVKWGSCLSYNMACLSQLESLKLLAVKAINSRSPANMEIVVKSPEVEKAGSPWSIQIRECTHNCMPSGDVPHGNWNQKASLRSTVPPGAGADVMKCTVFGYVSQGEYVKRIYDTQTQTLQLTGYYLFKKTPHIHKTFQGSHMYLDSNSGCFTKFPGKVTFSSFL